MEIRKSFDGITPDSQIDCGTCCQLSWATLKDSLTEAFNINGNEVLKGIVVTEYGIRAVIGYKK